VRYPVLILTCLAFATQLRAQFSSDNLWLHVDAGASNYDGELQQKRYTFSQAHLMGGVGVGYEFSPNFNVSTALDFTQLGGSDMYSTNPGARLRNLSFNTSLVEWNVRAEYQLFDLSDRSISPYGFVGLAIFHFNPWAYDSLNRKTYLRPLSTEGEGIPGSGVGQYSLTQFAIPFGVGLRIALSDNVRVGLEIGLRKTFTGYIDDVSGKYTSYAALMAAKGPEAVSMAFRTTELPSSETGNKDNVYPSAGFARGSGGDDWYYFTQLRVSFRLFNSSGRYLSCPPVPR
jgi:opacity protein-like surface antigen